MGWKTADPLGKKGARAQIRQRTHRKCHETCFIDLSCLVLTRSGKKRVQSPNRTLQGVLLREAHTGFHAWNDLAFGLAQKVEGFAVSLIRISEFSPESFHDVLIFITNAIPQRILFPNGLDLLHKRRVFFPSLKRGDFKDGKRNDVLAARTSEDLTLLCVWLVRGDGTAGMTRLTTAPQHGIIGDRCQTDHTWFGLRHQAKGSKSGLVKS